MAKADVHARDIDRGNTPLHEAVCKNREAIARLLLQHHADPESVNERRESVYDVCASVQLRDLIQKAITKRHQWAGTEMAAPSAFSWVRKSMTCGPSIVPRQPVSAPPLKAQRKRTTNKKKAQPLLVWG